MSTALVTICQQCYGPVVVVEQLELVPEEDMGWHHAVEVCLAPRVRLVAGPGRGRDAYPLKWSKSVGQDGRLCRIIR